jgi:hypothetical protein
VSTPQPEILTIPLNGYGMHVRPSELDSVVAGLGEFDTSRDDDRVTLVAALRALPVIDRAPTWELVIRRYGRRKPLTRASSEIGMDLLHAEELLARFLGGLAPRS